jgi:hypothetical protein
LNLHQYNQEVRKRHNYGRKPYKLTADQISAIRLSYTLDRNKKSLYALSTDYKVSVTTIWNIINRKGAYTYA